MSDQLENFIRNNRDKLDQQNPGSELWESLQQGLTQHAAAAGSSATGSAAAASKSGLGAKLAQVSTLWKAAAGIVATVAVGTAIYFASTSGGGNENQSSAPIVLQNEKGGQQKIEVQEAVMPLVNPPLPEADIPFLTHEVDAQKGGRWVLDNGTVMTIPQGIFVDENGKKVKGKVTIQYREFHDAADIILSGIPMVYYDNGKPEHFQTAGMTEIRGSQGESPVFIAEGKSIEVNMASFPEDDDYNFYFLDPEAREWKEIGKPELGPNKEKQRRVRMLPAKPTKPRKPNKAAGKNLDNAINLELEYGDFPELKPFKNIVWEALDKDYFHANQWSLTRKWNDVRLEEIDAEASEYRLVFTNKKTTFKLDVTPMLDGKDYEKATAKFKKRMEKYEKLYAQREAEEARLAEQADFARTFNISGFGIFNCDRYYNLSQTVVLDAEVILPEGVYAQEQNLLIYQITGENRAVITRTPKDMDKLRFLPTESNYLVSILGNNRIALFDHNDFKALNMQKIEETGKAELKFQMVEREIRTAADLRLAIGI